jgi:hypothetical protein
MKLNAAELAFLATWAREEKAANPYSLPAHQLQAAHQVPGVILIRAIKAWAQSEGRKDEDIFTLPTSPHLVWPWSSEEDLHTRVNGFGSGGSVAGETTVQNQ